MTSKISDFIIKTLCDNQGSLVFKRLDERITQNFTVADTVLRTVLFDDSKIAIQEGRQKVVGSQIISPDSLIVAKTGLRLCRKKPGECPQCDGLHLCKYYVCGDCTFGHDCKNPHSLKHNAELLMRNGLHKLTEEQLFQLLLQNDPYLLPEICTHYNKGKGPHGSCKFTTSCTKLHVCQHYLQGDCKFGSSCKRTHNFDAKGMKIFRGLSQENIRNLHEIYRNKCIIMDQQERRASAAPVLPAVRTEGNEICLFFIRKNCSFKEKCTRVHWHLPYKWQVLDSDGVTWKDLPNMEEIEKAYCDPEHDTNCLDQPSATLGIPRSRPFQSSTSPAVQSVDFMTMTYGGLPVRRLSTASSVSKPPHFILTTEWVWYWKDDSGEWLEFGQGDGDTSASVSSQTLENVYLANRDTEVRFGTGQHQYMFNFKGAPGTQQMYQQNVKYKTKREVKRRPRFVSAQDVEVKLKSPSSHSSSSSTAESFPSYWNKNALPDFGYKLVPLSKSAQDYKRIEMLFNRTMLESKINNIQRIQNPSLWKVFQWQKQQMKARNRGKDVSELHLFHGTDKSVIDAICEQNFDWRMCGVHGTPYGKGSYFARDASYSDIYTTNSEEYDSDSDKYDSDSDRYDSDSDRYASVKRTSTKTMFVALVLVGEYTRGNSSYVRPPPKEDSKTLYDSCVNCENDPSVYVVFEKQQIYPAYLINYS